MRFCLYSGSMHHREPFPILCEGGKEIQTDIFSQDRKRKATKRVQYRLEHLPELVKDFQLSLSCSKNCYLFTFFSVQLLWCVHFDVGNRSMEISYCPVHPFVMLLYVTSETSDNQVKNLTMNIQRWTAEHPNIAFFHFSFS